MYRSVLVVSLLLGCVWGSDVIELDENTFNDGVDVDIMLVEFYAPWCGHCKKLAPEYELAATALKTADPPIPLAKVDCPANSALCSRFGVTGYPTLKIFRDGEVSADYNGPRTSDGIVGYMKKQGGPSSRKIDSADKMRDFIDDDEYSIVGFFTSEDSKLKSAFMSAANALREDFKFGHTVSKDVAKQYELEDKIAIFQPPYMNTKLEEFPFVYDGPESSDKLKDFIKTKFMGIVGVRTMDNAKFFEPKKPLCVVYYDVDYGLNPKGTNYWRNRVIKVAKEFSDQGMSFAVSSITEFGQEIEALGLGGRKHAAGIYDNKGKYAMADEFTVDNFKGFLQQYYNGELENYVKSEPIPEDNDGPVKVVVGKNFDEIVNDEEKDVLIEFYAPWCGHCKSLAPKYEELGSKLANDPNIVIAKSDATANDYPSLYEVRGFPTIYWVPAGNKSKPEKYQGGREVDDFIKFLKENATNPPVIEGDKKKSKKKSEL